MQATYNTNHWLLEALLETPKQTKENFQEYDGFTSICCVCKSLWHFDMVAIHRLKEGPRSVQN